MKRQNRSNNPFIIKPLLFFLLLTTVFFPIKMQGQIPYPMIVSDSFLSVHSLLSQTSYAHCGTVQYDDRERADFLKKIPVVISCYDNLKLYTAIEDWYGKPYHRSGISKKGVDCSGFVLLVYKEVYNIEMNRSAREMERDILQVEKENLKEGDLLFFRIKNSKHTNHIGIYLKDGYFVHASVSRGVVIDHLGKKYWKKYYYKSGRCFSTAL